MLSSILTRCPTQSFHFMINNLFEQIRSPRKNIFHCEPLCSQTESRWSTRMGMCGRVSSAGRLPQMQKPKWAFLFHLCSIVLPATFYELSAHHEDSFCRQTSSVTQKPISREFRGRAISVEKLVARNPGLHNTRPSITRTKRVQWLSRWVFQFFYLIQSFPFQQQMDPSIPDDCMINSLIEKHGDVWVCTRYNNTPFVLILPIIFVFNFPSKLFSQGVARLQLMQGPKQIWRGT